MTHPPLADRHGDGFTGDGAREDKENDMATQVRYHANGLIDVDQGVHFGYRITYNPDDRRFYVQENDDDGDVLMTCGTMAEAVYAAHDLSNA